MQNGPSIRNIPAQRKRVCNGCDFLKTQPMERGRFVCTNNYSCFHPDFANEIPMLGYKTGKPIELRVEGDCETPNWCPFLKSKIK